MTREQAKDISNQKIFDILKTYTNMTDRDIRRHISQGVSVYENTPDGYENYKSECIAGLCDADDIPGNVGSAGNCRRFPHRLLPLTFRPLRGSFSYSKKIYPQNTQNFNNLVHL